MAAWKSPTKRSAAPGPEMAAPTWFAGTAGVPPWRESRSRLSPTKPALAKRRATSS